MPGPSEIAAAFLNALSENGRSRVDAAAVGRTFEVALATLAERFPNVVVSDAAAVARRLAAGDADEEGALPPYLADALLAASCVEGHPAAHTALDTVVSSTVPRAIARIESSPSFADVVTQTVREKLLLGERPKIGEYRGGAPLARWIASIAVRAALDVKRLRAEQAHDSIDSQIAAIGDDPEVAVLRQRYKGEFEAAVRAALGSLSAKERSLLRMNIGEGRSIDHLAASLNVGRSTAARWLAAAREQLFDAVRSELGRRVRLTRSEFDDVAEAIRSDLHVSLVRLLGE